MSYNRGSTYPTHTNNWLVGPDEYLSSLIFGIGIGNGSTVTANQAYYTPFCLPRDATCTAVSWNCTAGTSSGRNFDVGFYPDDGTWNKLSTQGGVLAVSGINTWSCSQPLVGGTRYFVALVGNNAGLGVWRRGPSSLQSRIVGMAIQSSAYPLPSTATPAQVSGTDLWPMISLSFAEIP